MKHKVVTANKAAAIINSADYSGFLRLKLGNALERTVALHIYETLDEAQAYLNKSRTQPNLKGASDT